MTGNKQEIFRLSSGMRVACRQTDGLVSYIGIVVNAGSRDETPNCDGLAHFVEHTVFKGTLSRKAWQIASRMETVGGELNAYTSKEETMIYTNAPCGYEGRAMDLLCDLVSHSSFPEKEVEKERGVVVEEIHSYLDSPSDAVYDEFEELAYAGSRLAHNILGTEESVRRLGSSDCLRFLESRYTAGEMVLYVQSPMPLSKSRAMAERYFGGFERTGEPLCRVAPPGMKEFDEVRDKGNYQANTIVGTRVFGRRDPRRFALFLLNNYLGGPGMNSRLNRELRDRRGFVYAVDSNVSLMSDTGLFAVYFGSEADKVGKCRKIIFDEIDRLAQSPLSPVVFDKIKRQYCGQLSVGSDHRENQAMSMAKSVMYYGAIHDIPMTAERISSVTPEEMRMAAELIASAPKGFLTLK